jgi:15-cis-phytoene synthase
VLFVPRRSELTRYDEVSQASASLVIRAYSSSFGMASRLLAEPVRTRICNVYALVRVADEIVDNPDQSVEREARARMLTGLEEEVRHGLASGHSANLVVHAFARTALDCGIEDELVAPFFDSMRTDLDATTHTQESFDRYVYGSAEVVGLMCLRVFLADEPGRHARYEELKDGARKLGAAFQKVNFVRDLAEDHDLLGRSYFPGLDVATFSDADRDRLLDDVDADLAVAAGAVPHLPRTSRRAVRAAHATFAELSARLRTTPAEEIRRRRVSVPTPAKARLLARALLRDGT